MSKLAQTLYGDGQYFFLGMGYYKQGKNRMALLMFDNSIFLLDMQMKHKKAKCGKRSCKLYLADSLYFRALVCSMRMQTNKAMADLHRLDRLNLLKKYEFWKNPGFHKLHGLNSWLKLVKKYKK
jgi:hypothetical protein